MSAAWRDGKHGHQKKVGRDHLTVDLGRSLHLIGAEEISAADGWAAHTLNQISIRVIAQIETGLLGLYLYELKALLRCKKQLVHLNSC